MKPIKLLLILSLMISCNNSNKKENPELKQTEASNLKQADSNRFIPDGYEIVKSNDTLNKIMTDLNNDTLLDCVVLLASSENNGNYSDSKMVYLAIYEGQINGSFQLKSRTGNLTGAFLHTNPEKRIHSIKGNIISVKHQSMRHDYELKIRYENKYNDYMLIGSEYNNYGGAMQNSAISVSTDFLNGKRASIKNENTLTTKIKTFYPISKIDDETIYKIIGG